MATDPPWLSVVMPSYRGHDWIGESLQSIANENDHGIEVLLVDGGPTDAAIDIATGFAGKLNLHIHRRPDLTTWMAKTNVGVGLANASHVCWLGVDDLWLAGRAQAIKAWIRSAPQSPLQLAPSAIIDRRRNILGSWKCPLRPDVPLSGAQVAKQLLVQNFVAAPAPLFRKDAWQRAGGLDEQLWYTADWDMWLKLALSGVVYYRSQATVGFRVHASSLTFSGSRDPVDFARQMTLVLERHAMSIQPVSPSWMHVARASITINTALAAAANGNPKALLAGARALLGLGPRGIWRYWVNSRIAERLIPRIRARLSRDF